MGRVQQVGSGESRIRADCVPLRFAQPPDPFHTLVTTHAKERPIALGATKTLAERATQKKHEQASVAEIVAATQNREERPSSGVRRPARANRRCTGSLNSRDSGSHILSENLRNLK